MKKVRLPTPPLPGGGPRRGGPHSLWPSQAVGGPWDFSIELPKGPLEPGTERSVVGGQEPARLPRALQPGRPRAWPPVVDTPSGERHHGSWFADKAQRG